MTQQPPLMPSFAAGFSGFHHTVDSALRILSALGVPSSRVTVQMLGLGYPLRRVVHQSPAPGAVLTGDVRVELGVAGLGYFHGLPVGMWDRGGDEEPGTRETLEVLDDPLQKVSHWIRNGARLFDIRADHPDHCARWLRLFGIDADAWPEKCWYPLALLAPRLRRFTDSERGIRLILDRLLGLPLLELRYVPAHRSIPAEDTTRLGQRMSRLGVDSVVGDRIADLAKIALVIGPVPLSIYQQYQEGGGERLLARVLALCIGHDRQRQIRWIVLDPMRPPRLGDQVRNSMLGINSYLGRLATVSEVS